MAPYHDHSAAVGLFSILIPLILPALWIAIAYFKRKRQVGKKWSHPLSAKIHINNTLLKCQHCQKDLFHKREAVIGTSLVAIFFSIFWNQSGVAYECKSCGHLHWFSRPNETEAIFHRDPEGS